MKEILALLLSIVLTLNAYADKSNCISDVCFPSEISSENLKLVNVAKFRYFGFSVYAAALYSNGTAKDIKNWIDTGLNPLSVALTLHYFMEFTPEDFKKSGTQLIKENKNISYDEVKDGVDKINSIYSSVKESDRYTILFVPGKGIDLLLNGKSLGIIPGDAFGRAYLGVWLSKTSVGESFTDSLLAQK